MRFGLFARDSLDSLLKTDTDGTYGVFDYLRGRHDAVSVAVPPGGSLVPEQHDVLFFLYYPFTPAVARGLLPLEGRVPVVNSPSGVLLTSEKTYELGRFKEYLPETMLLTPSCDVYGFLSSRSLFILKPVDGTGGRGVELLEAADPGQEQNLCEFAAHSPGRYLVQEFIPNEGDKRVLCYNGRVLGHFGRYNPDKHVNNVSAGGRVVDVPLSRREARLCEEVASMLLADGVSYVGIDLLEGRLLEVNTACPGGLGLSKAYRSSRHPFDLFREESYRLAVAGVSRSA